MKFVPTIFPISMSKSHRRKYSASRRPSLSYLVASATPLYTE